MARKCSSSFGQLFASRVPGHLQPVGQPFGTWMHNAMRGVKDKGIPLLLFH